MDENNSPIFSQAKLEYTNQLIDTLTPHIFDGIKSIYDEAGTVNSVNKTQSITLLFRDFLENVPSWSNVLIEAETKRIITMSNCDWLDDLITAVFISHTKILTSIGTNSSNIDLIIPKITNFVHKCYINIAREMWKNPYLFTEYSIASEYQKNMRTVELIIKESIENTIRQLLPIKEILKHNLDKHESKSVNGKSFIESSDIRKILHEEIKNLKLGNILNTQMDDDELEGSENIQGEEEDNDEEEEEDENENEENHYMDRINTGVDEIKEDEIKEDEIDDDYVSVDEETIQQNCENLDINTIADENKEEIYDNADIVVKDVKDEKSMLEKFIENLTQTNDNDKVDDNDNDKLDDNDNDKIVDDKEDDSGKERIENIEDNLPNEETIKEEVKEVEKEDSFNENVIKKTETELISVEKISDNETVDEFFNDVSKIMENKTGVSVNKKPEKYTLFDDVDNKE